MLLGPTSRLLLLHEDPWDSINPPCRIRDSRLVVSLLPSRRRVVGDRFLVGQSSVLCLRPVVPRTFEREPKWPPPQKYVDWKRLVQIT